MRRWLALALLGALQITPALALEFHGHNCTNDCSEHEAGYKWAQDKGIDDPDSCSGNSQSFIEGCRAAAEEISSDYDEPNDSHQIKGRFFEFVVSALIILILTIITSGRRNT